MKTLFIGSKNIFDENLVSWLSQKTNLSGVVWSTSTQWRQSFKGKLDFTKKRLKRYGLLKTIDEMLFFYVHRKYHAQNDHKALLDEIILPYRDSNFRMWTGKAIFSSNVNKKSTLEFIRSCKPDIILAMCVNDYFGKELLSIPKLGVFLWHEGITPEYRGLYSPFWAVHNLDFDNIGYTLLKMNKKIDAGEIYVQGKCKDIDPFNHFHGYIGHKIIWSSLESVGKFLIDIENGEAKPIDTEGRKENYYTYPGFSDYIRQRIRLRKIKNRGKVNFRQ